MHTIVTKSGKRGTIVIPAAMRKKFALTEGSLVIMEAREEGLLIRPAVAVPVENYTPERKAEFLLSNAISPEDYEHARESVRKMDLNPDTIHHYSPFKRHEKTLS